MLRKSNPTFGCLFYECSILSYLAIQSNWFITHAETDNVLIDNSYIKKCSSQWFKHQYPLMVHSHLVPTWISFSKRSGTNQMHRLKSSLVFNLHTWHKMLLLMRSSMPCVFRDVVQCLFVGHVFFHLHSFCCCHNCIFDLKEACRRKVNHQHTFYSIIILLMGVVTPLTTGGNS